MKAAAKKASWKKQTLSQVQSGGQDLDGEEGGTSSTEREESLQRHLRGSRMVYHIYLLNWLWTIWFWRLKVFGKKFSGFSWNWETGAQTAPCVSKELSVSPLLLATFLLCASVFISSLQTALCALPSVCPAQLQRRCVSLSGPQYQIPQTRCPSVATLWWGKSFECSLTWISSMFFDSVL